jgi:hypothetical protein
MPTSTACAGSCGVDSSLWTLMLPSTSPTKSVKVPPVSTPTVTSDRLVLRSRFRTGIREPQKDNSSPLSICSRLCRGPRNPRTCHFWEYLETRFCASGRHSSSMVESMAGRSRSNLPSREARRYLQSFESGGGAPLRLSSRDSHSIVSNTLKFPGSFAASSAATASASG